MAEPGAYGHHEDAERAVNDAGLEDEALVRRIERLARILDTQFELFGFRFGADGIIGLLPGVGDLSTAILSGYLIVEAARAGAGPQLIVRMVINVLIDTLLGAVPVFGDIFDFAFRANAMNAKLLRDYLQKRAEENQA
ncbi:MAG: DUF4112 domain-containing protein [Pseudomonadota bacterium]